MEQFEASSTNSRFQFGKKWFWIGIAMAVSNIGAGLVYGIALMIEKERRKEGAAIAVFAIVWVVFAVFVLGPWLVNSGILPQYKLLRMN